LPGGPLANELKHIHTVPELKKLEA